MDFRIIVLSLLFLGACAASKEKKAKEVDVKFEISEANPHCGGAAPMPGHEYPTLQAFVDCELVVCAVKDENQRGKVLLSFKTDANGKAVVQLPKGKYQLWKPSKLLSFKEFSETEMSVKSANYKYRDEACFQKWYDTPDFEFEVGETSEFKFVYHNRCFTGHHPCMIYTGPYPP